MRATEVILAKARGETHSRAELQSFLGGHLAGRVPDYQVAAWLMAVRWRGMDPRETADLTAVMAESGDVLDLSGLPRAVDKHSTGGVGDKTSLALAPLLAAAGATVAKMSGRGLGHTGGTVDKLESVPGFRTSLSDDDFFRQAREVGVVITGQSKELAPLDGLLYALRDATGTVESLPLIASSIMSKKLAGGAGAMVLDVKAGRGAFMATLDDARELARAMMDIGARHGRAVRCVLSGMEQPLGRAVGNAVEVREAVDCLEGGGPPDLRELVLVLASEALGAVGLDGSRARLEELLDGGAAREALDRWLEAQGGDPRALARLGPAPGERVLRAPRAGVVSEVDALSVGRAVGALGGGRERKGDPIDPDVGAFVEVGIGDEVAEGDALIALRHRDGRGLDEALAALEGAFVVTDGPAEVPPLVHEILR